MHFQYALILLMNRFTIGTVVRQQVSSVTTPLFLLTLGEDMHEESAYFSAVVLMNGDALAPTSSQAGQISIWPVSQFTESSWIELGRWVSQ